MKKNLVLSALIIFFVFASCNKKKDISIPDTTVQNIPFSTDSVSQNKEMLSNSGVEMTQELSTFKDQQIFSVIANMGDLFTKTDISVMGKSARIPGQLNRILQVLSAYKQNKADMITVFHNLKATDPIDSVTSISDAFNALKGLYVWNPDLKDFNQPTASDKIELQFPATNASTTNNASILIYNYSGYKPSEAVDGYTGDLPASVNMDLKVDGTVLLSYSFSASYNSKGIPQRATTVLTIGDFKFTTILKNLSSEVGYRYLFEHGSKTLFDMVAEANGNFSNFAETQTDNPTDILDSANAYVQVLNVRVAGKVNFKALYNGKTKLDQQYSEFNDAEAVSLQQEINKDVKMIVYFTDTKKKIADMQAVVYVGTFEEWEWVFNPQLGYSQQKLVTKTEPEIDMQFVFADGSKVDAKTFFDEGFQKVIDEMDKVMNDAETKYNLNSGK